MIIGIVFKNGKEIDRGIWTGGKKWTKEDPEQYIYITNDTENGIEKKYTHKDGISFQELQKNNGIWEIVYDSNEKIDRTVSYPLPSWLFNCNEPVPLHRHTMNEDGTITTKFIGYAK